MEGRLHESVGQQTVPIFRVTDFDGLPEDTGRTLTVPFTVRPDTVASVRGDETRCVLFAVMRNNARLTQLVNDDNLLPMPRRGIPGDPGQAPPQDVVLVKSPVWDARLVDICHLEAEPAAPEAIVGVAFLDRSQLKR